MMDELRDSYTACGIGSDEVLSTARIVVGILQFSNVVYSENEQGHGKAILPVDKRRS